MANMNLKNKAAKKKPHLSVAVTDKQLVEWNKDAKSEQRSLSSWVRSTLDEKVQNKNGASK